MSHAPLVSLFAGSLLFVTAAGALAQEPAAAPPAARPDCFEPCPDGREPGGRAIEKSPTTRSGNRLWILGLPFGAGGARGGSYERPSGLFVAYGYEFDTFRVDLRLQGETHGSGGSSFGGVAGSWLPLAGGLSPYLTLGFGYGSILGNGGSTSNGNLSASGVTATAEAGLEFLRQHSARLMVGAHLVIPFYSTKALDLSLPAAPGVHLRVAF